MNCSPSPAAEQDEERWREVDEERLRELKKKKKTGLNCDVADSGQKEREKERLLPVQQWIGTCRHCSSHLRHCGDAESAQLAPNTFKTPQNQNLIRRKGLRLALQEGCAATGQEQTL